MATDRFFGEINGITPGALFGSRAALPKAGVHPPTMAGISGGQDEEADSIVASGGYAQRVGRVPHVILG